MCGFNCASIFNPPDHCEYLGGGNLRNRLLVKPWEYVSLQALKNSIGMLVSLITVAVLLTSGMQRMLITALLDSYQWLAVGELSVTQEPSLWFDRAAVVATWSFTLALRIVLPVMAIMVIVNLALGWISRQSPALNHFVIGIPLNTFVLFGAVMLTLGSAMLAMQIEIQAALATLGVL